MRDQAKAATVATIAVAVLTGWHYGTSSPIGVDMWHSFGEPEDQEVALATRAFANHQAPDSSVAAWGFNPTYQRQGPDDISLVWAFESNYQPNPLDPNQHLAEWYVQFHGRDDEGQYYGKRPLRGSIERETGRTDAGFAVDVIRFADGDGRNMGRIFGSYGQAPPRWELPPTGYLAQTAPNAAAVMGMHGGGLFQMVAALGPTTRIGQPGSTGGVRIEGPPQFVWARPTATTCAELGEALHAIGLINWAPAP